jgi:uncharacterized surface protein with fasciclin (FAS1) repeats
MRRQIVATLTASALAIGVIAAPVAAQPADRDGTIIDVAVAANAPDGAFPGQLSILIAALDAADPSITATLDGNGQFTVFAPTNDAFLNLLEILDLTADEVLADEALLNSVLTYHVARGNRDSDDVLGSSRIRTLNGAFVRQSGGELIDRNAATPNAGFVATDVPASNGVIHVIDQVLVP